MTVLRQKMIEFLPHIVPTLAPSASTVCPSGENAETFEKTLKNSFFSVRSVAD